jgi:hypothetical protein
VVARLDGLREAWTSRMEGVLFATLGAASYLDAWPSYRELAHARNPLLRAHFGELLERLRGELERLLDDPVRFAEPFALPGFHLWGMPGIPRPGDASLHFDLQYERLPWPDEARPGFAKPLSFTLPLRLPAAGGGLTHWDLSKGRVDAFYARTGLDVSIDELSRLTSERFAAYQPGELVVHSGHLLHRIAGVDTLAPDDRRVTLQGHGLFFQGAWHLYW